MIPKSGNWFSDEIMRLIGISRGDFAGDLGAFVEISANCEVGGRCAGAISLLKAAVTTIEARYDLAPPLAIQRPRVDQRLQFVAPFLPFIGSAEGAQVMQRAHDFGEPRQVAVERRRRRLLRARRQRKAEQEASGGEQLLQVLRSGHYEG